MKLKVRCQQRVFYTVSSVQLLFIIDSEYLAGTMSLACLAACLVLNPACNDKDIDAPALWIAWGHAVVSITKDNRE